MNEWPLLLCVQQGQGEQGKQDEQSAKHKIRPSGSSRLLQKAYFIPVAFHTEASEATAWSSRESVVCPHNSMKVQFDFPVHDSPHAFDKTIGFVV